MKKIYGWLFICLVIIGACVWIGSHFLNGAYIAAKITRLSEQSGQTIEFAQQPRFTLFPPALVFGRTNWQGRIGAARVNFTVTGGKAEPNPVSLIFGKLALAELALERPELRVTIGAISDSAVKSGRSATIPEIGRLIIRNGAIEITNGPESLRLENLRLVAQNIQPRNDAEIQGDCVVAYQQNEENFAGNLAAKAKLRYYAPNLTFRDASLTFTVTEPAFLSEWAPLQLQIDGALDFAAEKARLQPIFMTSPCLEIKANGEYEKGQFTGDAQAAGDLESFSGIQAHFDATANLKINKKALLINDLKFDFAGASGSGSAILNFPNAKTGATFTADLKAGWLNLGGMGWKEREKSTRVQVSQWPEFKIKLDLAGIKREKFSLSDISLFLTGAGNRLTLEELTGKWAGGLVKLKGQASDDRVALEGAGQQISLGKVLSQFNISGLAAGPASFNANFTAKGADKGLLSTLSGTGRLECHDLRLEPLGELALLLPLLGKKGAALPDVLDRLSIALNAENGQLELEPIQALGPGFQADGSAKIDLAEELVKGSMKIRALGLNIPFAFAGPFGSISWKLEQALFKEF